MDAAKTPHIPWSPPRQPGPNKVKNLLLAALVGLGAVWLVWAMLGDAPGESRGSSRATVVATRYDPTRANSHYCVYYTVPGTSTPWNKCFLSPSGCYEQATIGYPLPDSCQGDRQTVAPSTVMVSFLNR